MGKQYHETHTHTQNKKHLKILKKSQSAKNEIYYSVPKPTELLSQMAKNLLETRKNAKNYMQIH